MTKTFIKTAVYSVISIFAATPNVFGQSPASDYPETDARIVILFPFDKSEIDRGFMDNAQSLDALHDIMTEQASRFRIDSVIITGSSSPDGSPSYNRVLAKRRANSIRDFILENYRDVNPSVCRAFADGEYWGGLIGLVEEDPDVPSREKLLKTIRNPSLSDDTKIWRMEKMQGGETLAYLRKNYKLRHLRQGSVAITFMSEAAEPLPPATVPAKETEPLPEPIPEPEPAAASVPEKVKSRNPRNPLPFALRTNLLFDLMGAPNIGVEIPAGNHFSFAGDFTYAYIRICNRYAVQTIQGSLEARYWFKQRRNILTGWNLGVYGTYCSRFDMQMGHGYQGDGYWSCGLTGGYSVPIGKRLNLDLSVAGGFLYSPEIREYSKPQDGHLIWEKTTYNASRIALTQVRANLVWLINTKVK